MVLIYWIFNILGSSFYQLIAEFSVSAFFLQNPLNFKIVVLNTNALKARGDI